MENKSQIIRRADITKNFCIIPNSIAQSTKITPNAKSLIIHILSKPDNWYYVKTNFWRETNLGRNAFNKAWKELEDYGFIKSERIMDGNLIRGFNYIISDSPIFGLTESGTIQKLDNPKAGRQIKKDTTKEDLTKKDSTKKDSTKTIDYSIINKGFEFLYDDEL
jgi:predicted transcriptional regulator